MSDGIKKLEEVAVATDLAQAKKGVTDALKAALEASGITGEKAASLISKVEAGLTEVENEMAPEKVEKAFRGYEEFIATQVKEHGILASTAALTMVAAQVIGCAPGSIQVGFLNLFAEGLNATSGEARMLLVKGGPGKAAEKAGKSPLGFNVPPASA